ncbi:Detected protein of confused Function [Hibiscus syriacus]|uniref:PRA1 family protein n=1 Tax=Hibiscus syriacus TaxID=106335 RepID=A0A6A3B121_HIBSY|nr:Detected protein of confused Function [Hibiscus syriacus]
MTRYGTIPAELPPSSNFISQAREQIRFGLGIRREWKEMVKTESIKLPTNLNEAIQRFRTNAAHFHVNYVIVVLFLLFITLLWQPVSLIVFIIMMAAWLFLYFLRDDPVSIEGFIIDDRIVMTGLLGITIAYTKKKQLYRWHRLRHALWKNQAGAVKERGLRHYSLS